MLGSNLNIMSPEWTDVIFKDRNQAYGAYQLRKDNGHTTAMALLIATSLFGAALVIPTIISTMQGVNPNAVVVPSDIPTIVHLTPITILHEKIPQAVQQKQVVASTNTVEYKPMVVAPDDKPHTDPVANSAFKDATPGPSTMAGTPGAGPAIDEKQGTEAVPGGEGNGKNVVFNAVEINPEYPGGEVAFGKFLQSHIRYPNVAKENGTQGRVFLQFVVERDGSLTDMHIIRNPGSGLGEEAVRVLKMSPHWKPGIQNGEKVRVQFTVPVNFALAE